MSKGGYLGRMLKLYEGIDDEVGGTLRVKAVMRSVEEWGLQLDKQWRWNPRGST